MEASRKPLLAEVEALKQRLRKTSAEITETKRQIGRDESVLTGKKDAADLTKRGATLRSSSHHPTVLLCPVLRHLTDT